MSAADLQTTDHRDLLDIIDRLRSQGFSRYVDLPEIIVCGDQSAGKSSVLEAISGMSFPTKDNLCTRFATEIILRRDPRDSIKISITPGDDRDPDEKKSLSNWEPEADFEKDGLEEVIEEAKVVMGLSATKVFCNDTLRVELSGPQQLHLTLVDLPGLFRAGNKEQSADNVGLVKQMVTRYMNRPRSIILAVISAKNEYVLQEVTVLAEKADPMRVRTMGLITKPDTLDSGSDTQQAWVNLALNKDVELDLGWHILKNRSYDEREFTLVQRDAAEAEFFRKDVWAAVDSAQCGVKSLRTRLSSVLKQQILDQLPSFVEEVERGIEDCTSELERMGDARQTPAQQLRYLSRISQDFSLLMTAATKGDYNNPFFGKTSHFEGYENRLRAVIQNRLMDFAEEMTLHGQQEPILDSDNDESITDRGIDRDDYIEKVKGQMKCSRGCELPGLFNPLIITDLFAQQCQPWQQIVASLAEDVVESVYGTARSIIQHVAAEEVVDDLLLVVNDRIDELKANLDQKIQSLLQPHYNFHAITYNSQLTVNVQEAQRTRIRRAIKNKIRKTFGTKSFNEPNYKLNVNPAQIVDLFLDEIDQDMEHFGSSTAVDYMEAYYKVCSPYPV